jgi:hypothetical protein
MFFGITAQAQNITTLTPTPFDAERPPEDVMASP